MNGELIAEKRTGIPPRIEDENQMISGDLSNGFYVPGSLDWYYVFQSSDVTGSKTEVCIKPGASPWRTDSSTCWTLGTSAQFYPD